MAQSQLWLCKLFLQAEFKCRLQPLKFFFPSLKYCPCLFVSHRINSTVHTGRFGEGHPHSHKVFTQLISDIAPCLHYSQFRAIELSLFSYQAFLSQLFSFETLS